MEYDWFWVILAVAVFAAVAIVPLELALDAYRRWRERRRKQREREIAERRSAPVGRENQDTKPSITPTSRAQLPLMCVLAKSSSRARDRGQNDKFHGIIKCYSGASAAE
jgi:hypothetical protein